MLNDAHQDLPAVNVQPFIRLGWIVLLGGLGSFMLWAAFAPLEKGVVSSGTVMVDGYRKVIQSPTAGVVAKIAVTEGQQVHKGETLVLLSQRSPLAQLNAARQNYFNVLIAERRLQAELIGADTLTLPPLAQDESIKQQLQPVVLRQQQLLHARVEALQQAQLNDRQTIDGLTRQRNALVVACQNKEKGLSLLHRQLQDLKSLMVEGYYPRNRYIDLQLQAETLAGEIGETRSRILELDNQSEQLQRTMQQRLMDNRKEIETQLEQVRQQINEGQKQLTLSDVDLALTRITAPQDGIVMDLDLTNENAVVSAGEKLMELVPPTPNLMIESRLDVAMIDKVKVGMPVTLMFTAFNQQRTPKIPAIVTLVSADRQTDPSNGHPYYKIQIVVSAQGMKQIKHQAIKPGMPVEVFIKAGERSMLSYLVKPILDRAARSFIED